MDLRRSKRLAAAAAAAAAHQDPSSSRSPPPSRPPPPLQRTQRGATSKQQQHQSAAEAPDDDGDSLYSAILLEKCSLQQLVDNWIEHYQSNRTTAALRLKQFNSISASGCNAKVTSEMVHKSNYDSAIRKMEKQFDNENGIYPIVMSSQQWRKFTSNYCDFVQILVKQCQQHDIIHDQYIIVNVIALLKRLSCSKVRAFRHTATLGIMKLMTALKDVALTISINLRNTPRQHNLEREKLQENLDEIEGMLTYMFQWIFARLCKDTLPDIRANCISELGVWLKKFRNNFLNDSSLEYIGRALDDEVGVVRLKCLEALQPLYAGEEHKGDLKIFTSKWKDRIVAMTSDKEKDVAVLAVKIVTLIHNL